MAGVAFGLAAAYALYRLYAFKKQLKDLVRQLRRYHRGESGQKLVLDWHDPALEELAAEINRHTELIEQANAEKRRSETELRRAVANISHDLRTPLTSITGYIQLLESGQMTEEEGREAIAVVKNRTIRLKSLLNDFFELSVLDSPDYRLKLERVQLGRILPDILLGFYERMNEKKLRPQFRLAEEPLPATADESAVRRVIENLMLNTLRHAEGAIDVALQRQGEEAVLTIRNAAPHLRGFDLELLFNRFYMADQSRSGSSGGGNAGTGSGGSGLGLSIARGLMEKMDGSLRAEMDGDDLVMTCTWRLEK
nr:histidine kinase dimerization/phospho-acceptor domain-containing protein [Cohnella thailandensis]